MSSFRMRANMDFSNLSKQISESGAQVTWVHAKATHSRAGAEICRDIDREVARLTSCGVVPGARVGIRASNSYRWLVVDLALLSMRAVSVAFTSDFGNADPAELIESHQLSLLFVDERELRKNPRKQAGLLAIEDIDTVTPVLGVAIVCDDLDFDRPWLIFSSGSAGGVKGIVLSRRGVEASVSAATEALDCGSQDSLLLFLPMSNFQQRMLHYATLWVGGQLIISDQVNVFVALKVFRPTVLVAPPVFYDIIARKIESLSPAIRSLLAAVDLLSAVLPSTIAEKLARKAYASVYAALGGRMRVMLTGMAPSRPATLDVFRRMRLPLYETYGLIESGSVSLNVPKARKIGSAGRPLRGARIKIAEDGEILVRRKKPVAIGYFAASPGENERVFVGNNWVATGDIGEFDNDDYLHIRGRKKLLIVSDGGEKFHPEVLEKRLEQCPGVRHVVVFKPDDHPTMRMIVSAEKVDRTLAGAIDQVLVDHNNTHASFRASGPIVVDEFFDVNNGMLRPNMKIDRSAVIAKYYVE